MLSEESVNAKRLKIRQIKYYISLIKTLGEDLSNDIIWSTDPYSKMQNNQSASANVGNRNQNSSAMSSDIGDFFHSLREERVDVLNLRLM